MGYFENKKVLVAGGSGFIGTNLAIKLLEDKAIVKSADLQEPQLRNSKAEYVKRDFTKEEDCHKAVEGMDYVFMAAANTSGAAVMEKTPLVHVTPNIMMNSLMLKASYEAGVKKFLFISSNTVYPNSEDPVKEEDMEYGNLYPKYYFVAWMKQFSEVLCEMYTKVKNPMKTVVVRPANSYGPYAEFDWERSHVIPALVRKAVERHDPIEVWGDGNDIKDFIYIEDLVEGMMLAMEKIESFEPVNLATGQPCTIKEILNAILKAADYEDAKIAFDASKPTMIPKRLINPAKAKNLLGFEARTSIEEGIKKMVDWYKNKTIK